MIRLKPSDDAFHPSLPAEDYPPTSAAGHPVRYLPGKEFIQTDPKYLAKRAVYRDIRQTNAAFPFGNRFIAHTEPVRHLPLCQPQCFSFSAIYFPIFTRSIPVLLFKQWYQFFYIDHTISYRKFTPLESRIGNSWAFDPVCIKMQLYKSLRYLPY